MQEACISCNDTLENSEDNLREIWTTSFNEDSPIDSSSTYNVPESLPPAYEMEPLPPALKSSTMHTQDNSYRSINLKAYKRSIIRLNNTSLFHYGSKILNRQGAL